MEKKRVLQWKRGYMRAILPKLACMSHAHIQRTICCVHNSCTHTTDNVIYVVYVCSSSDPLTTVEQGACGSHACITWGGPWCETTRLHHLHTKMSMNNNVKLKNLLVKYHHTSSQLYSTCTPVNCHPKTLHFQP